MLEHVIGGKLHGSDACDQKNKLIQICPLTCFAEFRLNPDSVKEQSGKGKESPEDTPAYKRHRGGGGQNHPLNEDGFDGGQYHGPQPKLNFSPFKQPPTKPLVGRVQHEVTPVDDQRDTQHSPNTGYL